MPLLLTALLLYLLVRARYLHSWLSNNGSKNFCSMVAHTKITRVPVLTGRVHFDVSILRPFWRVHFLFWRNFGLGSLKFFFRSEQLDHMWSAIPKVIVYPIVEYLIYYTIGPSSLFSTHSDDSCGLNVFHWLKMQVVQFVDLISSVFQLYTQDSSVSLFFLCHQGLVH